LSIEPGQSLSHYRIHEKIGEGGMGEVYRATDTTLGRDVAIKVLPEEVAGNPERLARFQREAQLLASLNHPNIAAIYGLEESGETPFLVLELIEGEDLSGRLSRGLIPASETLEIARQIAEALEEAHEQGIVHRDLKPANIKLTPAGKVKVLDFGLAKAFETTPDGRIDPSLSPTLTVAATRAGIIMGTAAYMSPEQARGAAVDKRADIWAFGCVILEMLTGRGTFAGDTISDILASVLKTEPEWEGLPPDTPRALRRLLRRCLQKDPRKRLRDIGEARIRIEEMLAGTAEEETASTAPAMASTGPRRWPLITIGAMVVTAVLTALLVPSFRGDSPDLAVQKFEIVRESLEIDSQYAPVLSPDGARIAYVNQNRLWIRELDNLEARPLSGTDGARYPFWAPDSDFLGYVKDGSIWKISTRGGQATTIAGAVGTFNTAGGLAWGEDGRIVFSRGSTGLSEVSARGGDPQDILSPAPETESDFHQPHVLPDGRGILFVVHRMPSGPDTLCVFSGGERKVILQLDSQFLWAPFYSSTGHILYRRRGTNAGLWAAPFSLSRLEVTGEPFLIEPDGDYPTVSADGTLLYIRGAGSGLRQLVRVNREGVVEGTIGQPQARIASPSVSPDGRHVAVMARENESWDIWIHDVERGTRTRLTFGAGQDWDPTWTPDGKRVIFWDGSTRAISMKAADGTGETEILVTEKIIDSGIPSVSPDGKLMAFWGINRETREDLYTMPLDGDRKPVMLLQTPASEEHPRISPDGRYLAYVSDESGRVEVYLTQFPGGEGKWQVSVNGGQTPAWDRRGDRLYYREEDAIMEVDVVTEPAVELGSPRKLFTAVEAGVEIFGYTRFDVAPDERFMMVREIKEEGVEPSLVLVRNWLSEFQEQE